mmetsp:Transcript_10344/g.15878  ORF Transcript_10344/g.15878 Transcript_10344/m.15878 type:complete len:95 (+) Transcript_10344:884-1168(+)
MTQCRHNIGARVIIHKKEQSPVPNESYEQMYRDFCKRYGIGQSHHVKNGVNELNGEPYSVLALELKNSLSEAMKIEQVNYFEEILDIHKLIVEG